MRRTYAEGSGPAPGIWRAAEGQRRRLLDAGVVCECSNDLLPRFHLTLLLPDASKDFLDPLGKRRIMWGHVSTSTTGLTGSCMTLP